MWSWMSISWYKVEALALSNWKVGKMQMLRADITKLSVEPLKDTTETLFEILMTILSAAKFRCATSAMAKRSSLSELELMDFTVSASISLG